MPALESFPALNATLNGVTTLLLLAGYGAIKSGRQNLHRALMTLAILTSAVFLGCYLYYHAHHGATRFTAQGWPRYTYFTILISHTILAVVVLPLIIAAVVHAIRGNFEKHKAITRWAWPIWLYVSITGVLIYFMLYQWWPAQTVL
jgi:uncharacterized membrane protein YozB (DUF420 family)